MVMVLFMPTTPSKENVPVAANGIISFFFMADYMTYMGKESKKQWIYVTNSLCCTAETNRTLYINHTPIKIF